MNGIIRQNYFERSIIFGINGNPLKLLGINKSRLMRGLFFFKFSKKTKAYFKVYRKTRFKSVVQCDFSKFLTDTLFTIIAVKKEFCSKKTLGLIKFSPLNEVSILTEVDRMVFFNKIGAKYSNDYKFSGSLCFFNLFWGYKIDLSYGLLPADSTLAFTKTMGIIAALVKLQLGTLVYNVIDSESGKLYGSAQGCYCLFNDVFPDYGMASIILPSRKEIRVGGSSLAIAGRSSNIYNRLFDVKKASNRFFYTKKKVNVRGIAMNPIDHPNGGRTKVKTPFMTPWGLIAKKGK